MREIALPHVDMVQHPASRPKPRVTTLKNGDGVRTPNVIRLDGERIRAAVLKRFSRRRKNPVV